MSVPKSPPLTQERLKEFLEYNPETGIFRWIKKTNGRGVLGGEAGTDHSGYRMIGVSGQRYLAHRLAWLYIYGEMPGGEVDHINHDRSDNRIKNLRAVSHKINSRNRSMSCANKSGDWGVFFYPHLRKKWRVKVGTRWHGSFETRDLAITKRDKVAQRGGYHENHNRR